MNDLLHAAVVNLLDKLDEVTESTIGIFQMAQIHGMVYTGPTYEAEYNLVRTLSGTDRPPKTPDRDWDEWEKDNCTGCNIRSRPIHYMEECPIHGHNAAWKNVEAAYGLHYEDDCVACVINPNDIVWFNSECPVHYSLSDGRSILDTYHHDVVEEEADGFRQLAEADYARAMAARFDGLRETIKELAALEREHQTKFRPSREWLERMYKLEDECGGHISVGGLAADLGMLQKPLDPDTFLMMGVNGEPMGTMSNPSMDDLLYYMREDGASVRLMSDREVELAKRCNSHGDCPAEDPDIVECPMHPELGG